jgi:ribosomal protein S27E
MQQLLEKSEIRFGGRDRERLFDTGEKCTLDDVVWRLSQSLAVRGNATCLVCGASFVRVTGGTASAAAHCPDCGSRFE